MSHGLSVSARVPYAQAGLGSTLFGWLMLLLAELRETSSQSEHGSIGPLVTRGLGLRCSAGRRGLALLWGTVYFRFFLWGALCGGALGVDHFCER